MAVAVEAPTRRVPMTALTRPVPQGSTWIDCEARGLQHDYVGSKTTDAAVYLRCSRCPVVVRKNRIVSAWQRATCPECGRVFDLTDETQAEEYHFGHDCEV